jgi:hypothetical protein
MLHLRRSMRAAPSCVPTCIAARRLDAASMRMEVAMRREDAARPASDKPGPAKGEAYGIAAVTQTLEGLDFPASKADVVAHLRGRDKIGWTKTKTVNLRQLVEDSGKDDFESMASIVHFVSEAAREEGITGERSRDSERDLGARRDV